MIPATIVDPKRRASKPFGLAAAVVLILIAAGSQAGELRFPVLQRAYFDALENGDENAASEFAYSAWQAAEKELGDSGITATLAYLYGRQVILSDVELAAQALKRAKRLSEAGKVDLYETDLELYYAYADLVSGRFKLSEARSLAKALADVDGQKTESELAVIWPAAASNEYPVGAQVERLREAAAIYAPEIGPVPVDARSLARALMFRGAVRVVSPGSSRQDIVAADQDFLLACSLLPAPRSIGSYDPMLAQSLAWQMLARGIAKKLGLQDMREDPSYAKLDGVSCRWQTEDFASDLAAGCEYRTWRPVWAPLNNYRKPGDNYDAVVYGFQLDQNLNILEPRILAEAPKRRHGEETLRRMTGNHVAADGVGNVCRRDVISSWYYVAALPHSYVPRP